MLCILGLAVTLFVSDLVRIDVAAVLIMVLLGLLTLLPGLTNIVGIDDLFSGFASNAVMSIVAVMIIGAGLDKTGLMSRVVGLIMRVGGTQERGVIPLLAGSVGVISSFTYPASTAAA